MTLPTIDAGWRVSRRTLLSSTALAAGMAASGRFSLSGAPVSAQTDASVFFDGAVVHDLHALFDDEAYQTVIAAYQDTAKKEWLLAALTIDDESFDDVGFRLKGNSSLMGLRGGNGGGPGAFFQEGDGTPVAGAFPFPAGGTPVAGEFQIIINGTPIAGEFPPISPARMGVNAHLPQLATCPASLPMNQRVCPGWCDSIAKSRTRISTG
ncbi:MAG: hypothetical protein KF883_02060 [Thermomicrobiales bacterium]|nr:hypothetical protein [Thermomicrobiales bacterium]